MSARLKIGYRETALSAIIDASIFTLMTKLVFRFETMRPLGLRNYHAARVDFGVLPGDGFVPVALLIMRFKQRLLFGWIAGGLE